jgi:hypothetical protein
MSSESGQLVKASSFGVGLAGMPVGRCELETVKAEAGCHHARHQRPPTERRCRLPLAGRDDHLGSLAGREVSSKHVMLQRSVTGRDRQPQWATIVIEPQLVGIDSMPVRPLTRSQQEVDSRARRSLSLLNRRSPGFDVPAAFRMGLQSERVDELVGVHIPTVCPLWTAGWSRKNRTAHSPRPWRSPLTWNASTPRDAVGAENVVVVI